MKKLLMIALLSLLLLCGCAKNTPSSSSAAPVDDGTRPAVRIIAGGEERIYALPESGQRRITIRQQTSEGEIINRICLTPEGMFMEESTCPGQDCVEQTTATVDNWEFRTLGAFVICLPNQVSAELLTE